MVLFARRRQGAAPTAGCLIALITLVIVGLIVVIGVVVTFVIVLGSFSDVSTPEVGHGQDHSPSSSPMPSRTAVTGEWEGS